MAALLPADPSRLHDAAAVAFACPDVLVSSDDGAASMLAELAATYYGLWNNGSTALFEATVSPGYTDRTLPASRQQGPSGLADAGAAFFTAFPDGRVKVLQQMLVRDRTYAVLRWVHDNADRLGVDRNRIAIGGASAGGGHAAMLALAARDRREVLVAYQVLIYPMLDDRTGSVRSARPGTGEFVWTAASNRFGWGALLGMPAGSTHVPAGTVPGRRTDLAGLPPAFIGVGTLDLFLDEDIAYAEGLTAAGVPVDLVVVPGAYHAFDSVADQARASHAFTTRWQDDLVRALA